MLLQTALRQIPSIKAEGVQDTDISGICYDSRQVRRGDLFVAIRGAKTDGASFVKQAVEQGAAAVATEGPVARGEGAVYFTVPDAREFLAEFSRIFFEDPAARMELAAVTGTNGKTTTTYLLESIFRRAGKPCCVSGTIGMRTDSRRFDSRHTTPESSDLTRFLHQALEEGCTHGALEISSHSLILKRVYGMKFRVGVFMNLTADHLDFHKTMEEYFDAKMLLFSEENRNRIESAVVNVDDGYGKRIGDSFGSTVLRFGFSADADIRVLESRTGTDRTDLLIATPGGEISFRTGLIGRHNAYNIMAATGAALSMDIPRDAIREGVESLEEVPGRFERVDAGQDFTVIVDYAHTPDALLNLLNLVSELPHKRIITVFGCGGDRDRTKRPVMGSIAARKSDISIVTSDNPRTENPLDIIGEIVSGMGGSTRNISVVEDRREAIGQAVASARSGDIVVIAGKGHEDYQIVGGTKNPFDDRLIAREWILRYSGKRDAR
jgi:UDP-N-acetylmuramoyl-L-alanyl-D-glutamate--2,6-diaminopimelate ligase